MIEIFSTARQVREFYESFSQNSQLLTKAITISEFESKAWSVPESVLADEDTRMLLMREAASFENFKKLKIPHEFMAFLQNSEYLFRFFEELANEEIEIEELDIYDTYAEFSEHITILKELSERYGALLKKNSLHDSIILPKSARINSSYLASLKEIRIHLEGYLNAFEIRLLEEAKKFCNIHLLVPITAYNKKVKKWLESEGIATSLNTLAECDLNERKLIKEVSLYSGAPEIFYQSFSSSVLQAASVFEKIEMMVNLGIEPQNIAVVLPDESFAPVLKEFDRFHNLNFAMGFSMERSFFYQRAQAVLKYAKNSEIEERKRVERLAIQAEIFNELSKKTAALDAVAKLKTFIKEDDPKDETDIILSELFLFEKFLNKTAPLPFLDTLQLFLKRVKDKSLDDNRGGKVTVMGVLESRGAKYKGVIITHFNDDIVPKRSSKDLFISSSIRAKCGLPSIEDRENLQRFFYDRLINNASIVTISAVENENKLPSRFLKTLHDIKRLNYDESTYVDIIIQKNQTKRADQKQFSMEYDFFGQPLSSSRLKTYFECSLKYFFKYIKHYEEPKQFKYDAKDTGNFVHDILYGVFEEDPVSLENMLKKADEVAEQIKDKYPNSALWKLETDIWLAKLKTVFDNEIKRYKDGWRVFKREEWFERKTDGIWIVGKIDRIDKCGDEYLLLDYKTGRIDIQKSENRALEANNFQLEFYTLLCADLGSISAAFYDLNKAKIIEDNFFDLKKMRLMEHLHVLKNKKEFIFEASEDKKQCFFCSYKIVCGARV
ncbi:MAG: PD-(D/E)XK nuclease family protein [Campylobacteraceae bacterium]|jgi:hypothetical protein|nr:PD-(D/E)XK nuclease family protein [Campylobacteraceae bacterium]